MRFFKGMKQWKVKKTTRTVLYTTTLEEGTFFGEIEIIRKVPRLNKVVALTDCYVLSINAGKFFESKDCSEGNEITNSVKKFSKAKTSDD